MSIIAGKIDEVIKSGPAGLLKENGFKKSSRTFHKQMGEDWLIVHVQASTVNFGSEGKFAVNLGIYNSEVSTKAGKSPIKGKPKEYQATLRERLGELVHGYDYWWEIRDGSDLAAIGANVVEAMRQYGLKWFSENMPIAAVSRLLKKQPSRESIAATLLSGDEEEAKRRLQEFVKERPRAEKHFMEWAVSIGLITR
ncbi:MAG: DUF4304 domain-containing protein [bacterium]|nr:DUF4304 domain-containing protein [bacterium]